VNFYNLGRNIDELMRKFKANLYMAKKPSEVCPSKWREEGDQTFAPSAEMVGRVPRGVAAAVDRRRPSGDAGRRRGFGL